ncbi:MAG: hypothetical protein AAF958_18455 [Planctomycetota bacterium]
MHWPEGWSDQIERLRSRAMIAIRRSGLRTHLVLRQVDGDPAVLLDFLSELHTFAESESKQLWVHNPSIELRQLATKVRSPVRFPVAAPAGDAQPSTNSQTAGQTPARGTNGSGDRSGSDSGVDIPAAADADIMLADAPESRSGHAGDDAAAALNKILNRGSSEEYSVSTKSLVESKPKRKRSRRDYLILAGVIVGSTIVIGLVQFFIVFTDETREVKLDGMIKRQEVREDPTIALKLENEELKRQIKALEAEREELRATIKVLRELP